MPDPFTNARPYYDPTFPSSGDSFSISGFKNALQALAFLDVLPLQPKAHNPANTSIMVRGRDASSYYNPVYYGDANQRIPFSSGDSPAFGAPSSNPRLDIVYITPSGDLKIAQGTESASPTLPTLSPSGDSRFPVCAVWNKVGQTKIVNFEDKDSNSGDGYIYQDLRPWMRTAGAGAPALTSSVPLTPTGDNIVGTGATAARTDHRHQGIHTIRVPGSGDLYGDIELEGANAIQSGNRIILGHGRYETKTISTSVDETTTSSTFVDTSLVWTFKPLREGVVFIYFSGISTGGGGYQGFYALEIDGIIKAQTMYQQGSGGGAGSVGLSHSEFLSSSNHTVKIRHRTGGTEALKGTLAPATLVITYPT